jgi:hypothetical protein
LEPSFDTGAGGRGWSQIRRQQTGLGLFNLLPLGQRVAIYIVIFLFTQYRIQDTGEEDDKAGQFRQSLAAIAYKLNYKCRKKWQKALDFPLFVIFFLGIFFKCALQRRLFKIAYISCLVS